MKSTGGGAPRMSFKARTLAHKKKLREQKKLEHQKKLAAPPKAAAEGGEGGATRAAGGATRAGTDEGAVAPEDEKPQLDSVLVWQQATDENVEAPKPQ